MKTRFVLLVNGIFSLLVLAIVISVCDSQGVSIAVATRDPTSIAGIHPLMGFMSNLGILLWCISATVCLFVAVALRNLADNKVVSFLFASGALSAWLTLDDLFQIHEDLAQRYFGVGEPLMYLLLGIGVAAYLIAYRRLIVRTSYVLLLISVGFLSWAVAADSILQGALAHLGRGWSVIEGGQKWLGITFWCSYYISMACQFLKPHLHADGDHPANM